MEDGREVQMFIKRGFWLSVLVVTLSGAASAAPDGRLCRELAASARGDDALFVKTDGRYKRISQRAIVTVKQLDMDRAFIFVPRARLANRALVVLAKVYGRGSEGVRTVRIERGGFRDDKFDLNTYNQYHNKRVDNVVLARKFHFDYQFEGVGRRTDDSGRRERFLFEGVESPSTAYSGIFFRNVFGTPAFAADERTVKLKPHLYDQTLEPRCIAFTVETQPRATQMFIQIERLDQLPTAAGRLKWHLQQAGN
jgi:hypothetical protein